MKAKTCAICGCTEEEACRPFGCSWVTKRPAVCSACLWFLFNVRDPAKVLELLKVLGVGPEEAMCRTFVQVDDADGSAVMGTFSRGVVPSASRSKSDRRRPRHRPVGGGA